MVPRPVNLLVSRGDPTSVERMAALLGCSESLFCLRTFENDPLLVEYEKLKLPSNWFWFIGPVKSDYYSYIKECEALFPGYYVSSGYPV